MAHRSFLTFDAATDHHVRVLIASTDKTTVRPLAAALLEDEHDVLWVYGATELVFALESAGDGAGLPPDLLILDGELGAETILRFLERYRDVLANSPVFVISARLFDEAEVDMLGQQCITMVDRPLDLDDLRTAVMNLDTLRRTHALQSNRPSNVRIRACRSASPCEDILKEGA